MIAACKPYPSTLSPTWMKLSTAWPFIAGGVKGGMTSILLTLLRSMATARYSISSRDVACGELTTKQVTPPFSPSLLLNSENH